MKQDKWTQQLHDKLAEHETAAPSDLWADIEAALPNAQPSPLTSHPSPLTPHLSPLTSHLSPLTSHRWAAAVALLLLGGARVWWSQQSQQSEPQLVQAESATPELEKPAIAQQGDQLSAEEPTIPIATPTTPSSMPTTAHSHSLAQSQPQQPQPTHTPTDNNAHTPSAPSAQSSHTAHSPHLSHYPHQSSNPHQSHHPRLTLALYATNSFGTHDNSNAVMMADALAKTYTYTTSHAASRQAPIFLTGYEERQHHSLPFSLGLSVSCPLTGRLSLTSGLVYTRLRSEFTQTVRSMHYTKEQALHYVGIPLGLSYCLWRNKRFRLYVATAVQADWNVKARVETEGVGQHTDRDRLQWSVSGSLGAQYSVAPRLSLFAEPGVSHYFDNGSPLQNYFKDKPTSLKLQAGLRLDLK